MLLSLLLFLPPAAYQVLAITAAVQHIRKHRALRRHPSSVAAPVTGVSVLKPLRGLDPNTRAAFLSQIRQSTPEFEILFGVSDPDDPAADEVRNLQAQYPEAAIHLHIADSNFPNRKVGLLAALGHHARYPVWVVNDSDILVTPDYLNVVTRPLADPAVGIVTCLYRAKAHTTPAAWESLGISTDFMPSTLVAQLLGVREFGLGSTLAFRAADLTATGGFEAFGDYIADDYQLSRRITALGKRTVLSELPVETSLGEATWSGIWHHQLRWARTIRASKGLAYSGVILTQAGVWSLLLLALRGRRFAAALSLLRIASAFLTTRFVLDDGPNQRLSPLAPLWDCYAFAIWFAAHTGRTVSWRGRMLRLDSEGRILPG